MAHADPRLDDIPATVNDDIYDRAIRHALWLERYKTHEQDEILRQLDDSLRRVLDRLDGRLARISARGYDAGPLTTRRLQELARAYDEIIRRVSQEGWNTLREDLFDLALNEAEWQRGIIESGLPIEFEMTLPAMSRLRAAVTSAPMDGRLLRQWFGDATAQSRKIFMETVRRGIAEGLTFRDIVRELRGTTFERIEGGVLKRFEDQYGALTRSAISHVSVQAREELYRQNSRLIKGVKWVLTLDLSTCLTCVHHASKKTRLGQGVYPVGEGPRPPAHVNCRCTTSPVTRSFRSLGIDLDEPPPGLRASMGGQVPRDMTWDQWLRRQSTEIQNEALGPKRAVEYRAGRFKATEFTNRRGRKLTIPELRKLEPEAFRRRRP